MKEVYVIKATNQDNKEMFYSIDSSCGYPYWGGFYHAKQFDSVDSVRDIIRNDSMFTEETHFSDGQIRPPHMIDTGIGLCNEVPRGELYIEVCKIVLEPCYVEVVKGEIKKPKNVVYEY